MDTGKATPHPRRGRADDAVAGVCAAWPPWQYAEAGAVAALVAIGFTHVEAVELAIALGELRKGKDRRVTQLIATLSARYHSACSEQAAVPRGEAA